MNISTKLSTLLKSGLFALFGAFLIGSLNPETAKAQEFSTGVDLYTTYVWRGTAFAGPSLQPYVEFGSGGFAIGAWGSQPFNGEGQEMDLYAGYTFDFGLSLGLTDYYYPGTPWLDDNSHAFEINAGYSIDALSLSGNFIVNEAPGAGSDGGDLYFEAGYAITDAASVFLGAGNGWHSVESAAGETPNPDGTYDDVFTVVNIGITTGKEIKISDTFSIPVTGSVILNPYTEQFYILAGLSF